MSPGNRVMPEASRISTPGGRVTAPLGPTISIRSPLINTAESFNTGDPVPSIKLAPINAFIPVIRSSDLQGVKTRSLKPGC